MSPYSLRNAATPADKSVEKKHSKKCQKSFKTSVEKDVKYSIEKCFEKRVERESKKPQKAQKKLTYMSVMTFNLTLPPTPSALLMRANGIDQLFLTSNLITAERSHRTVKTSLTLLTRVSPRGSEKVWLRLTHRGERSHTELSVKCCVVYYRRGNIYSLSSFKPPDVSLLAVSR